MRKYNPTSPARRQAEMVSTQGLAKKEPEKALTFGWKRPVGRNSFGRITTRHKGGGVKRLFRVIDFLYDKKNMPVIFGSKEFKEKILNGVEEEQLQSSRSDYNKTRETPSIHDVERICAVYFKVDKEKLHKTHGKGNEARKIAIYGSRVWAKEKLSMIADYYHCQNHSSISKAVKNIQVKIECEVKFADKIKKIHALLF